MMSVMVMMMMVIVLLDDALRLQSSSERKRAGRVVGISSLSSSSLDSPCVCVDHEEITRNVAAAAAFRRRSAEKAKAETEAVVESAHYCTAQRRGTLQESFFYRTRRRC